MKKKITVFIMLVLALTISVIGCASKTQTEPDKAASSAKTGSEKASLEKVVIAEPAKGENWLPVFLADKLGYFKEEGLDVKFTDFKGGPLVIASLLAGDSQFALTGYEQVMKTTDKGKSTKMIIATSAKHPWSLVAAKNIKTIADLKGKKISAGMDGSSPRAFVRACLKDGGLDPNKDAQYVSLPNGGELGAMEKGEVAAAFVGGRNKIALIRRGFNPLVDLTREEQHQKVLGSKDYPLFVVQVTDDYIKSHPETIQKFTNAVAKAMKWQSEHSDEEIAEVIAPLYPNIDKGLLVEDVKDTRLTLSNDGYFTKAGHDAAVKLSLDVGLISKPIPMENVVDESFMKKAHNKLGK